MHSLWMCLAQQHDPQLILLAGCSALLASFAALNLLVRAGASAKARIGIWLCGSGLFTLSAGCALLTAFAAFTEKMGGSYLPMALIGPLGLLALGCTAGFACIGLGGHRRGLRLLAIPCLAAGFVGATLYALQALSLPMPLAAVSATTIGASFAAAAAFVALMLLRLGAGRFRQRLEASVHLTAALAISYLGIVSSQPVLLGLPPYHRPIFDLPALLAVAVTIGLTATLLALLAEIMEQSLARRVRHESRKMLTIAGAGFEGTLIHRHGVVLEASEQLCRLGGWLPESLTGMAVIDLVKPADAERTAAFLGQGLEATASLSVELCAQDGTLRPVEFVTYPIAYDAAGDALMLGIRDVSARMRDAERIRHLAHHDALTGLPNRFLLNDRLTHLLSIADRAGSSVGVFVLGLDRFKPVNDLLGHEAGDAVLNEVARRLQEVLRSTDTPARLGGDEFAIIQPMVQQASEAATLAQRVIDALNMPFVIAGQKVEIGVSIGIALSPQSGRTGPELLRNADTAMNRAKDEDRGTYLFFERMMDEQLQQRRLLEKDLQQAQDRQQLELHYQPLFDAKTVALVGFEALIRWNHHERGMISPAEFIPLAEESGLIASIGRWVLERACEDAAGWGREHRVAVNLSPAQFRQNDLLEQVAYALARSGLPAERLELEVTEGVLIDNSRRAREVLDGLKLLGVNISLDDFGTGYSSLSYLRRFPFDKIKIDRAFVSGLGEDDEAAAIVRAIVALGHSLKLSVTAEGVETAAQLSALHALNCNQVQGFLLGRPTPKEGLPFYFAQYDEIVAELATKPVMSTVVPLVRAG